MKQQKDRVPIEESHNRYAGVNKAETDCQRELSADVNSYSSHVSDFSSEPPSIVDDSSSAISYDGADIIGELGNLAFPKLIDSSIEVPYYYYSDTMSCSSGTSRVSELSSQPLSVVDDSSDDDVDELINTFPMESIEVTVMTEPTSPASSNSPPPPSETSNDDHWDDILNWMRSKESDTSLEDKGAIRPFEKDMLEKLVTALPTKTRTSKVEEITIEWERIPPIHHPRIEKQSPKEDAPSDYGLILTSWLQVPFAFERLLKAESTVEWVRNISHAFFDFSTSIVMDRLTSWWSEKQEESTSSEGINPSPTERTSFDTRKPEQAVERPVQAEKCPQTAPKTHKLNDDGSVGSMETLETHISKFSDGPLQTSWTWRVAEV